jgi:hypothetical protein
VSARRGTSKLWTFEKASKSSHFRPDNHVKCRSFWVILAGFESARSA